MNKFISIILLFTAQAWTSDYAYNDKNYAEAEVLYKKYWEKDGKIEHFRSYLKTLIRQNKYEKSLEIIQLTRIEDDYVNYLKNYCHLALSKFDHLDDTLKNQELIDYINVKKGKKSSPKSDLSRLLNLDDFDSIESPFYQLYFLVQEKDIIKINSHIIKNFQDLRSANNHYQWMSLLEAYKILKSHKEMIADDIKDFIVHNCKILDIRKMVNGDYFREDKYELYSKKMYKSFTNTDSFEKLISLSQSGKISQNDLNQLIALNSSNKENFCFIKASIERNPELFLQLYKDYNKEEYLYYMFVSCLQKKDSFSLIFSYRDQLLSERKILLAYINYLQYTNLELYENIQKLDFYVDKKDPEVVNNYGRLIYKHDKQKALDIWKSNPSSSSHRYVLYHDFNEGNKIKLEDGDKENKNLLALEGILNFRNNNYQYTQSEFPEDEYLYQQHLFLRSVYLSQSAKFAESANLLDPNSPNPFIAGKCADFLFLLYGLENKDEYLDQALSIYKNLPKNKIYAASLRYKIFNCLREKNDEKSMIDFIEDKIFSSKLDPKNYYDRRLLYDVYRYCFSKDYPSFCESISNIYGIKP
ncbi:hypothetical protein PQO01_02670 [Lentisphaera marina]|uniref:hypothetical protein n=1 Tax=Lentisphaera marina TaxID=1111041 RepID=UPI0023669DCB|nr:hypothetical protein [Lentisphaera marina]MDD7983851.1 hypothetical protein [Lentisphaera marina]